jgi:hypothetical protein
MEQQDQLDQQEHLQVQPPLVSRVLVVLGELLAPQDHKEFVVLMRHVPGAR